MNYEIFGADASAADVARQVSELGSVVIRQTWPREPLGKLRGQIQAFCDKRREDVKQGTAAFAAAKMYSSHGVGTLSEIMKANALDFDALRALFMTSKYRDICAAYYDSDKLYCQASRCGFREHMPAESKKSFIPYHQDSYSQSKNIKNVLNCWMPLSPCGRNAPGLEVVMDRCYPDFPRKDFGLATENAAYDFITIAREKIVEVFGEKFLAPIFDVGDCLIFSQDVIHRTYVTEEMDRPRINFEFRVFAENCIDAEVRNDVLNSGSLIPLH